MEAEDEEVTRGDDAGRVGGREVVGAGRDVVLEDAEAETGAEAGEGPEGLRSRELLLRREGW